MDRIAVIGDSHVNFFGGNEYLRWTSLVDNKGIHETVRFIDNFQPFHLGSALAYNTNKYNTATKAREKTEWLLQQRVIKKGQIVLCSFGEIDLRVHVLRRAKERQIEYERIIDDILLSYMEFLLMLAKQNTVWVWGPIPSQVDGSKINPNYPYYGTETERNKATEYFNNKLQELCDKYGFTYLSIFKYLIMDNYKTKADYIADGCHLSQKAWIFAIEEFKKLGVNIIFNKDWHNAVWENRKLVSKLLNNGSCNTKENKTIALGNQAEMSNFFIEGSDWLRYPNLYFAKQDGDEVTKEFLYYAYRIMDEYKPKKILEFNFGQTTKMVAQYAARYQISHTVLEHDRERVEHFISVWKIPWTFTAFYGSPLLSVTCNGFPGVVYQNFNQVTEGKNYDFILLKCPFGGG